MKFRIYQIVNIHNPYIFMDYDYAKTHDFNIGDYHMVYDGEMNANLPIDTALELIYRHFNVNQPLDYGGRSLSVSDIVEIDRKFWYCNDSGWIILPITTVLNGGYTS